MIIVDTSVWVDLLRDRSTPEVEWLRLNLGYQDVNLLDLTVCELLQGSLNRREFDELHAMLKKFTPFSTCGFSLAVDSAANYMSLRKRGVTVRSTIDCLIATFCIQGDYVLLHNDRDFDPFEKHLGLKVLHV